MYLNEEIKTKFSIEHGLVPDRKKIKKNYSFIKKKFLVGN